MTMIDAVVLMPWLAVLQVCPVAPGDADKYTDKIIGYVLWGVGVLFLVAIVVAVGAIVAGRVFSMPHASKVGVVSIVVVFLAAIAYLTLPGVLAAMMGSGCIGGDGKPAKPAATAKP